MNSLILRVILDGFGLNFSFLKNIKYHIINVKLLLLFLVFPLLSFSQKVYSVDYSNQSDINVFVVEYENQCDLKVYKVDYPNQTKGNKGLWYFVDYPNQSDKKIYFVEYPNQADLKIFCRLSKSVWLEK